MPTIKRKELKVETPIEITPQSQGTVNINLTLKIVVEGAEVDTITTPSNNPEKLPQPKPQKEEPEPEVPDEIFKSGDFISGFGK